MFKRTLLLAAVLSVGLMTTGLHASQSGFVDDPVPAVAGESDQGGTVAGATSAPPVAVPDDAGAAANVSGIPRWLRCARLCGQRCRHVPGRLRTVCFLGCMAWCMSGPGSPAVGP